MHNLKFNLPIIRTILSNNQNHPRLHYTCVAVWQHVVAAWNCNQAHWCDQLLLYDTVCNSMSARDTLVSISIHLPISFKHTIKCEKFKRNVYICIVCSQLIHHNVTRRQSEETPNSVSNCSWRLRLFSDRTTVASVITQTEDSSDKTYT